MFVDNHMDQPGKSRTPRGRRRRQPPRRRSILAAALGLWAVLGADWAAGQMLGATPAARALSGGKAALMRRGVKTVDLTIVVPQHYAKTLGKAVEEFRLKTGITVKDMLVVSERDVLRRMRAEATSKAGRLDLFLAPSTGIPEGVESRALLPLDDLIRVGRPDLNAEVPAFRSLGRYRSKTYGLFANTEVLVLVIRRDLMALPAERSTFKRKYGWDPDCPDSWLQWKQLAEFFTRESTDEKNASKYYGALGVRSLGQGWRWWLQRYYSKGKTPFDEEMNPTLDSPEAVEATKEYVEISKYMPEASMAWTREETVSAFLKGKVFSILTVASAVHAIKRPGRSKVANKVKFCTVPGSLVGGGPFRRALSMGSVLWQISRYSPYPEAAYWLAQWLTSPKVSTGLVARPNSNFTPHRSTHFEHPKVKASYTPKLIGILKGLMQVMVPEIPLVGAAEYHEVLSRNLFEAVPGTLSPRDAMMGTLKEWKEIAAKLGRKRQIQAWKSHLRGLPKNDIPE